MTQNNGWIEWVWTPEKPYPETLDTMVYVKFRYGEESHKPYEVGFYYSEFPEYDHWFCAKEDGDITHYKLA